MLPKFRQFLRFLTLEQWSRIDQEHRQPSATVELRVAGTLLLAALLLTLQKYYASRNFFDANLAGFFVDWPQPKIWPHLYWSFGCAVTYFVVPALYVKYVFRSTLSDFGFNTRDFFRHLPIYLGLFSIVLPFVFFASAAPGFQQRYPFYAQAGRSWVELLIWEGAYAFQFLTLEFFFRGFLLFALVRHFGAYAIFVMVVPYTMIHFAKPLPETIGAILAGSALGTLALRTGSIAGGVSIHVAVAWTMDYLAMTQKGTFTPW